MYHGPSRISSDLCLASCKLKVMRTLATWLSEYSHDHQNKQNQRLHIVCVPVIMATVVGLLHLIAPASGAQLVGVEIGVGDLLLVTALIWYATLGLKALSLMALQLCVSLGLTVLLQHIFGKETVWILLALFAMTWIGQFYGHKLEGKRPSFFKDLQYLLIGPLWVWLGHK